jgi:hypothetical protein
MPVAGEAQERSIAGQVEFWAKLGRSVDELLDGRSRRALKESAGQKPLSELVASVGTGEGKARLKAYLESRPFPHFEPHPTRKGVLIRIEENGTRSVGRFIQRQFVVDPAAAEPAPSRANRESNKRTEGVITLFPSEEGVAERLLRKTAPNRATIEKPRQHRKSR